MLTFIPSRHEQVIAVEMDGKATRTDAEKFEETVKAKYKENEKFNIYAVIHDMDRPTLKGIAEGIKIDMKRWNQYNKVAVVSEKNWLEQAVGIERFLPGIQIKHFKPEQAEAAWDWLQQE